MEKIKAGIAIYNSQTDETGLVRRVDDDVCFISVRMTSEGRVITDDIGMALQDCRPATDEQKIAMQKALNRCRLVWDSYRRTIQHSDFTPKSGGYVRVSTLGENLIAGVYKGLDGQGNITMYCLLRKGGTLGYSQYETIGPAENYQFQPIGSHARITLIDALAKAGVAWNNRRRCLEYISTESVSKILHRSYFYIDEYMEIHEVQDAGKERDQKRILAGNYFDTREKAEAVRQCFVSVLRLESKAVAPSLRKRRK